MQLTSFQLSRAARGSFLAALVACACSPEPGAELGAATESTRSGAVATRAKTLVQLGNLHRGEVSTRIERQADIEADRRVDVYPKVGPAYVREIVVDEGDTVAKGDPLLLLDDVDFVLEVRRRESLLSQRRESENQAAHLTKEASARVRSMTAMHDRARGDYERAIEAQASGLEVLSEKELQDAEAEYARMQADLEAGKLAVERGAIELELARIAVQQAQIELESAEKDLRDCSVVAPIDGVVERRSVNAGLLVGTNTHLFTVVDPTKLRCYLSIPQEELAIVSRTGLPVEFELPALPGQRFIGSIEAINPTIDPANGQIRMRVRLPDESIGIVKPGMFAKCRVLVESKKDTILVSKRALQTELGKDWIFVHDNGRALRFEVQTGARTVNEVEVIAIDGRAPSLDLEIILVGQDRLRDGDPVEIAGRDS
jgi:membrane fusion protein, multidrug efflux system